MKALQFVTYLLLASNLIGQISENDLKGEWVLVNHQGTSGPNDTIMMVIRTNSQFHDLTLFVDEKIFLLKDDQSKKYLSSSMSQDDCDFQIKAIEIIENTDQYLFSNYLVRPMQLGLDRSDQVMMIISTTCENEMFDKIYYFDKDRIGLHMQATFFVFKRK